MTPKSVPILRRTLMVCLVLLALVSSVLLITAQDDDTTLRINRNYPNAPIAVFCQPDNLGYDVLRVDPVTGVGQITVSISRTQIPPVPAIEPVLFASGPAADVYRNPDGRLGIEGQFDANTRYVFRWNGDCFDPNATETLEPGRITGGVSLLAGTPNPLNDLFNDPLLQGVNSGTPQPPITFDPNDPIRQTAGGQSDDPINRSVDNAPVKMFCNGENTAIDILRIDPINGIGTLELIVERARIPAAPAATVGQILVASSQFADVYRLSNGNLTVEAQIEANTKYVFEWDGTCFDPNARIRLTPGRITGGVPVDVDAQLAEAAGIAQPQVDPRLVIVDPATLPNVGPSQSANVAGLPGYVITNRSPINLRAGDGAQYRSLALMLGGVNLEVTGRNESQTWWRVRTATGIEGWINAELLILRGDLSGAPVIGDETMGPLAPASFVTFLPKPVYSTPRQSQDFYVCDIQAGEYPILGSNPRGSYFQIVAPCLDGRVGRLWIAGTGDNGVLRNPSGDILPVIDPTPVPGPQAVDGPSFLVFSQQPIFFEPDRQTGTICEVPANRFPVIGRNDNSSFYQIAATCINGTPSIGWISADVGGFQSTNGAVVPNTAPNR